MKNHSSLSDRMYREHILELYKNPQNFGEIEKPSHEHTEYNSNCGDEITVQIKEKDGNVEDVKYHGSGCAISMASASLLTNKMKGMSIEDVKKLKKDDVLELLGIKVNPARMKCALLGLNAVHNSLK